MYIEENCPQCRRRMQPQYFDELELEPIGYTCDYCDIFAEPTLKEAN